MTRQNPAPWRQTLEDAIHNNAQAMHSRFFQLATVDNKQIPACRTVVFRGFADNTNALIAHTDERSEKILQLRSHSHAQVCWYFSETREQFRLTSQITVLTEKELYAADIRLAHWQQLSEQSQASYFLAAPGSAIAIEHAPSAKPNNRLQLDAKPSKNFALLLISPTCVDHLLLTPSAQQRTLYWEDHEGHWAAKKVSA